MSLRMMRKQPLRQPCCRVALLAKHEEGGCVSPRALLPSRLLCISQASDAFLAAAVASFPPPSKPRL